MYLIIQGFIYQMNISSHLMKGKEKKKEGNKCWYGFNIDMS